MANRRKSIERASNRLVKEPIKLFKPLVYIAGKVTGIEDEAKVLFEEAEIKLNRLGYFVINPMKLDHNHDKKWSSYMRVCIRALAKCDYIYLLDNYNESKGATLELAIAYNLEIKVLNNKKFKKIEAECNECEWKGLKLQLIHEFEDNKPVLFCPQCVSENIYYFN